MRGRERSSEALGVGGVRVTGEEAHGELYETQWARANRTGSRWPVKQQMDCALTVM